MKKNLKQAALVAAILTATSMNFVNAADVGTIDYSLSVGTTSNVSSNGNVADLTTTATRQTSAFIYSNGALESSGLYTDSTYSYTDVNNTQQQTIFSPVVTTVSPTTGSSGTGTITVQSTAIGSDLVNTLSENQSWANNMASTMISGVSDGITYASLQDDIIQSSLNEHAKAINTLTSITSDLYTDVQDLKNASSGTGGVVVYTDGNGNTVTKQADGTFQDASGNTVAASDVVASVTNPDGTTTNPTKLTNVADGTNSNDAVNKGQLDAAVAGVTNVVGTGADGRDGSTGADGASITGPTGKDGLNGQDLTTKVNALRNGEAGTLVYTNADGDRLVKANDGSYYLASDVNADGSTVSGATPVNDVKLSAVNSDGTTTNPTTISNVKAADLSATSTDAVNGSQLYATNQRVTTLEGDVSDLKTNVTNLTTEAAKHSSVSLADNNLTLAEGTNASGGVDYKLGLSKDISLNSVTTTDGNGNTTVMNPTGTTTTDNNGNKTETTATGTTTTDGNGNKTVSNATGVTNTDAAGNTATLSSTGVKATDAAGNTTNITANNWTTTDGQGNTTTITPGNVATTTDNGRTSTLGQEGLTVSKDGKSTTVNEDGLTSGNTTINNNGVTINNSTDSSKTVSLTDSGLNNGGNKLTNIADGTEASDAVNKGQMDAAINGVTGNINGLSHRVDNLDNRVNKVGAGAAALAALHPLDFNPDDKWNFAVGYGNYKNANAMAVGAFYRPNEDTMLSVAGSMGNGENMVNAGLSFKLGQSNGVSNSRVAMAQEIKKLKDAVNALVAQNDKLTGMVNSMSGQPVNHNTDFSDVPKDHWAYQYVKMLADKGLLEGYPDGQFKGDRQMTRYEFAAVIYRALQNGAVVDSDMGRAMSEFAPQLEEVKEADQFRVDRVAGKDNDRHKIDRVRVNNKDNKAKADFRDIYGNKIVK